MKKSAGARESGQDIAEPAHEPRDKALPSRADILAFILRGNGYPPGAQELPTDLDALKRIPLSR